MIVSSFMLFCERHKKREGRKTKDNAEERKRKEIHLMDGEEEEAVAEEELDAGIVAEGKGAGLQMSSNSTGVITNPERNVTVAKPGDSSSP